MVAMNRPSAGGRRKCVLLITVNTLIETPHEAGMLALVQPDALSLLPEAMRRSILGHIDRAFYAFTEEARRGERATDVRAHLETAVREVKGAIPPTDLRWSRELWFYTAFLERSSREKPKEMFLNLAEIYWNAVRAQTTLYRETRELLTWLREDSRWTVILLTQGDGRLQIDAEGNFAYDAKYSREKKLQRLPEELLQEHVLVVDRDPSDQSFWNHALAEVQCNLARDIIFMISDAYAQDIGNVTDMGVYGILLDRDGIIQDTKSEAPKASLIVRDLTTEVRDMLMEVAELWKLQN